MINNINLIPYNSPFKYKKSNKSTFSSKSEMITFRSLSHVPAHKDLYGSPFSVCRRITQKVRGLFNWPNKADLACKRLEDEVNELKIGIKNNDQTNIVEEIGDILFVLDDIAQMKGITLEEALKITNNKILKRLEIMEQISTKPLNENTTNVNNTLWNQAKIRLKCEKDL